MAIRIINKYIVKRLPDTYYCVYEETSGLLNLKSTIRHSFYVNGSHHGIGFYSLESESLYRTFVSLLNNRLVKGIGFYREYAQNPKCQELIQAINNQIPKRLSIFGHTSYFDFWNHSAFPAGKYHNKLVDSFSFGGISFQISFKFADNTSMYVDLSYEEYTFIYDFIIISFLVNLPEMAHKIYFTIKSDLACIEKANEKGWIE